MCRQIAPGRRHGKELIRHIFRSKDILREFIHVTFLPNYDINLGRLMTAGVDLWLNTPLPPMEASGTSGMKAALNGVPSLSVLDGWWIEGCIEGITGWAIGVDHAAVEGNWEHANSLYDKLEEVVLPMFVNNREQYHNVMRNAIALNGSFFNTQRMIQQYVLNAYLL
ncbi:MAG: glycogen/starch/alpha-glucan phosphorylase [Planctomycetaceae bacterium]|nr:glycogen/starch/alpha-glucan phosphorylase [Planctomycetaceae bacterium]